MKRGLTLITGFDFKALDVAFNRTGRIGSHIVVATEAHQGLDTMKSKCVFYRAM